MDFLLIKYYAREFRIKVEMKQIGARQEAGLVGGIGSVAESCAALPGAGFSSITSDAAQKQGLPPAARKWSAPAAAGNAACCMNWMFIWKHGRSFEELLFLKWQRNCKTVENGLSERDSGSRLTDAYRALLCLLKEVKEIIQLNKRGKTGIAQRIFARCGNRLANDK